MAERKRELISIIVPCYNEQAAIPFFYKEIDRISQVMKEETDFELLFVDDGSKDGRVTGACHQRQAGQVCFFFS